MDDTLRHDLRAPLTVITGFCDLLTNIDGLTEQQRDDYMARVRAAAEEVLALLDADAERRRL